MDTSPLTGDPTTARGEREREERASIRPILSVTVAAGLSGFADLHAAAASVAQLNAGGMLHVADTGWPVFVALATNSCSKLLMAWLRGGRGFLLRVLPGVLLVVAAFAAGLWLSA